MKVLIADDEVKTVNILRKFLENKDLLVDSALDGKEALRLIKEHGYDLVFLDVSMPELSGIEIASYMKKNGLSAVVIFITGYPELTEDFCKSALGVDEYLEKPVDLKVIGDIIDKYRPG